MIPLPWFKSWSLKTKFALSMGVLMFAFAVTFTTWTLRLIEEDIRSSVVDAQMALVRSTAADIDDKIELRRDAMATISELLSQAVPRPGAEMDAFFAPRPVLQKTFDVVLVVDEAGRVVHDIPARQSTPITGDALADQDYFRRIRAGERMVISSPRLGLDGGSPYIAFATPTHTREGRFSGGLVCIVMLSHRNFLGTLGDARVGKQGYFALVEHGANPLILMHRNKALIATVPPGGDANPILREAREGRSGSDEGVDAYGVQTLRSRAPLRSVPWVLIAFYPTAEAFEGLLARQRQVKWLGGGLFGAAALLAWLLSGWLLRPLRELRAAMDRLGPDAAVPISADGFGSLELSELATAYNAQAQRRREFEQRLRAISDNLPVLISYVDRNGNYGFMNQTFNTWLGIDTRAAIGRRMRDVIGDDVYANRAALLQRCLGGERVAFETVGQTLAGPKTLHIDYIPDVGLDGEVEGIYTLSSDITELREEQSQSARLADSLKVALEKAEQASVVKGQFVANVSHEIRTPMTAILGMLDLLLRTGLTTRQLDYVSKSRAAARSLLGLINDTLDFSKVEAGKMSLDPRVFSIDGLLRELSVILSSNPRAQLLDVLFDIDPAIPPLVRGDDMRLRQVLLNLCGNAMKFTGEGEVVLRSRVMERTGSDVLLEFAVCDTGIGIAPEHQTHVFSGFSQAEASTNRRFGGTGLGLAISQRLVALMGGELGVSSALGQGSTFSFRVRLPLADVVGVAPQSMDGPAALRVLLVDDNLTARSVFEALSRSLGWAAAAASDSTEALRWAGSPAGAGAPCDVVILDAQMPGHERMNVMKELRRLASEAGRPAPVVVMLGGHSDESLPEGRDGLLPGADGFLVRPFTASMLVDAVGAAREARSPAAATRCPAATSNRALAGLRLLVAEDNLNNQQVASELLSDEGAEIVLVGNGRLAVEAVMAAEPPFDAVLMDLQMPVMDGYAATRALRRLPGQQLLPIIAMTANAMASDREACLAAGMNDHVGKPFDLADLLATLCRHTGRGAAWLSAPSADGVPVACSLPDELLDDAHRRGVDLATAIGRMGGNTAAYLGMLPGCIAEITALPGCVEAALASGQVDEIRYLLHTFKGLCGTLGLKALASLLEAGEQLRPDLGSEALQAFTRRLAGLAGSAVRDLAEIAEALRHILPQPLRVAGDADPSTRRRILGELSALLRDSDMQALDVFEQLRLAVPTELAESLQPLAQAVLRLDFPQAVVHCQTLTTAWGSPVG